MRDKMSVADTTYGDYSGMSLFYAAYAEGLLHNDEFLWVKDAGSIINLVHELVKEVMDSNKGGMVFIDAGSRSSVEARRSFFMVKLSTLWKSINYEAVKYHVYEDIPYFISEGGSQLRQALTYIIELASALHYVLEEDVKIVFKHGPLIQQIQQYLREPYDIPERIAFASLRYAGLSDMRLIKDILAEACVGRKSVNAGLLAASIIHRIFKEARKRNIGVYGIVENTSMSSILTISIASELIYRAYSKQSGTDKASIDEVARLLSGQTAEGSAHMGDITMARCIGEKLDIPSRYAYLYWRNIIESVTNRAKRLGCKLEDLVCTETSIYHEARLLDMNDISLVALRNYLIGEVAITRPRPRSSVKLLYEITLNQRHGQDSINQLSDHIKTIPTPCYTYVLPGPPPSCSTIREKLRASKQQVLNILNEHNVAKLYRVSPPIRVETIVKSKNECYALPRNLGLASALIQASATITIYGFPPQFLLVDKFSRIDIYEAHIIEELARKDMERLQPYTALLRYWITRRESVVE